MGSKSLPPPEPTGGVGVVVEVVVVVVVVWFMDGPQWPKGDSTASPLSQLNLKKSYIEKHFCKFSFFWFPSLMQIAHFQDLQQDAIVTIFSTQVQTILPLLTCRW